MRPRTLAVLLVLVAALAGFIWFYERELPSTDERAEQSKRLLRLDEESIHSITLVSGERRVRLERSAKPDRLDAGDAESVEGAGFGAWLLSEPRSGRADAEEVKSFLERLLALEKQRSLEDVSRDQVGLGDPRAEVALETSSAALVLRFGSRIPASTNAVVELGAGPPFYVVSDDLLEDIGRAPNDWRSRDALPYEKTRIEKIEILEPSQIVLERRAENFRLIAPIEDAADRSAVDELLEALVGLEIETFVDDPDADFPPSPAGVRLTLAGADEPVLVEVAQRPGGDEALSRVRVDGEVVEAETDLALLLARGVSAWRSTSWTDFDAFEVEFFHLRRRGFESQAFALHEGEWRSGEENVEYATVNAFLRAVSEARGVPVAGPARAETPDIEIGLESNEGRVESLKLWSDGDRYTVERVGRQANLALDRESAERFAKALDDLEVPTESNAEVEAG